MSTSQRRHRLPPGGRIIDGERFAPSGFAVLRTPFLPLDSFLDWSADLRAHLLCEPEAEGIAEDRGDPPGTAPAPALRAALASDREIQRQRLADLFRRPDIRDALFLASPDLEGVLDRWLSDPDGKGLENVETALARYFQRMSCRPTPFGLFAGCSLVQLAEKTDLVLPDRSAYTRRSRLDMDYVSSLTADAAADPDVQPLMRYVPNDSIYRLGGRVRYVESRQGEKGRSHHLVSVTPDPYLDAALDAAAGGARIVDVAGALSAMDPELTDDETFPFVQELIAAQLLVPEIQPPVTGPEVMGSMLERIDGIVPGSRFASALRLARDTLAGCDAMGPGVPPARYRELARELDALPPEIDLKRLIQTDLYKPAPEATLSTRIAGEVLRGLEILMSLSMRSSETSLDRFRQAFLNRYEDREVPLAEVLDEESGIGFERTEATAAEGSPLLAGLRFMPGSPDHKVNWYPWHSLFLERLLEAEASGERVIRFEPEELRRFGSDGRQSLPDAFQVMVEVMGSRGADPGRDGDVQLIISGFMGPSGARLLGRFCHLDEGLRKAVQQHIRDEESHRPDAIFAEVVHLPEGRVGNVLLRPVFRKYEIPYLARSGVDEDRRIPLSDLLVSVRGNRIVLRSRRLGREVVPRITNAHNFFTNSIGVYKFLGLMQIQEHEMAPKWDWGPLERARFLPRVECGRLVFAHARWGLEEDDIRALTAAEGDDRFLAAQEMRRRLRFPRFLNLVDGDHLMPVDLDSPASIDVLCRLLRNRTRATLKEMLPAPEDTPVVGPEGRFRHELVIPYRREPSGETATAPATPPPAPSRAPSEVPAVPLHAPGSGWLFCKLYTGKATSDEVLRESVEPAVREVMGSGHAHRWFFLRYSDPDWHLRLRFQGEPDLLAAGALPAIHRACAPLMRDGRIWSIQLDTYIPELQRYGGPRGLPRAEAFFQADSEAVLRIVHGFDGDSAAEIRWLLAVRGVDRMLADLGFGIRDSLEIMDLARTSFWNEFNGHKQMRRQLGQTYRRYRTLVSLMMQRDEGAPGPSPDGLDPGHRTLWPALERGCEALQARTAGWRDAAREYRELDGAGGLAIPLGNIAGSLAHMHCNRILRSSARAHEMAIYDFMCREYRSLLARKR